MEHDQKEDVHELEVDVATMTIGALMTAWGKNNSSPPKKIWVSDNEELQSIIMLIASAFGLEYGRTQKQTYLE